MNWRKSAVLLSIIASWFAIDWMARGRFFPSSSPNNPELALVAQAGQAARYL